MDANGDETPSHRRRLQEQGPPLGPPRDEEPPGAEPLVAEAADRRGRRQPVVSLLL